jgi:GNAT superfamily N-acetyltransferase
MNVNKAFTIAPLENLSGIGKIVSASKAEGFRHIERLIEEWESGENRFSKPHEMLLAVKLGDDIVAIGGVNQEALLSTPSGRLRRFYVLSPFRRMGIGSMILKEIIRFSSGAFTHLTLYTDNPSAAHFYTCHGFIEVEREKISHILDLSPS